MNVGLTAGQAADLKAGIQTLEGVRVRRRRGRPRQRPKVAVGDSAYSFEPLRQWARQRGIRVVLPQRKDQRPRPGRRFDKARYRERNIVERVVGWLKEYRRIGTRYEKLAQNYLAMVHLALILDYLRALDSSDGA